MEKPKFAHTCWGSLFVLTIFWCPLSKREWHGWIHSFRWERRFSSHYSVKGTVGPRQTQPHTHQRRTHTPSPGGISLFGVDAFPLPPSFQMAFHYGIRTRHRNEFISVAKINGSTGNGWGRIFLIGPGKMPLIYIVLLGSGDTGSIWTSYSI